MTTNAPDITTVLPKRPRAAAKAASTRLPSLDGLRALSIALVLFQHLLGTAGFLSVAMQERIGNWGNLGVRIFFVISGFLISSLLFDEAAATGTVSLKQFYARRALRILPASYAYILIVLLLAGLGAVQVDRMQFVAAVAYFMNYKSLLSITATGPALAHLWSLAVEEQFYLLWPFLVYLLGKARGLWVIVGVIALVPLLRLFDLEFYRQHEMGIYAYFHTVSDALAAGCLLACLRSKLLVLNSYQKFLRSKLFAVVPFSIMAVIVFGHRYSGYMMLLGITFLNLAIAICIDRVVTLPRSLVGRVLNWRPVAYMGVLSYSIYLWQELFLVGALPWPWGVFPLNLLATFAAAWASHRLIERPFLGLRKRFAK